MFKARKSFHTSEDPTGRDVLDTNTKSAISNSDKLKLILNILHKFYKKSKSEIMLDLALERLKKEVPLGIETYNMICNLNTSGKFLKKK